MKRYYYGNLVCRCPAPWFVKTPNKPWRCANCGGFRPSNYPDDEADAQDVEELRWERNLAWTLCALFFALLLMALYLYHSDTMRWLELTRDVQP